MRQPLILCKKKLNGTLPGTNGSKGFDPEKWKRCAAQGIMSVIVPEEEGGLGLVAHVYAGIVPVLKFGSDLVTIRL